MANALAKQFSKQTEAFKKISETIRPTYLTMELDLDMKDIQQMSDKLKKAYVEAFRQTARDFIEDEIAPHIKSEYEDMSKDPQYWPRINVEGQKNTEQILAHKQKTAAYKKLLKYILMDAEGTQKGDTYIIGLGPLDKLLEIKGWEADWAPATRSAGSQEYSTWFYNVEFGTGKYARESMKRADGMTKDPKGDGSWWLRIGNPLDSKDKNLAEEGRKRARRAGLDKSKEDEVAEFMARLQAEGLDDEDNALAYEAAKASLKEIKAYGFKGRIGEQVFADDAEVLIDEKSFGVTTPKREKGKSNEKKDPRYRGDQILFGARVFGQKGFNLFFDDLGKPGEYWVKLIEEKFIPYFNKNFKKILAVKLREA